MAKVIINGWRYGMKKVQLTKLQVNLLNKGLKYSKNNTDMILDNEVVEIEISDLEIAKQFLREADKLGVNCVLIE